MASKRPKTDSASPKKKNSKPEMDLFKEKKEVEFVDSPTHEDIVPSEKENFPRNEDSTILQNKIEKPADTITEFSFSNPIYLQVHVGNIYSIFVTGLMVPTQYVHNRTFTDPQSIIPSALLFSNGIFTACDDSSAVIETNLRSEECRKFVITNGTLYYTFPLPVSRIKRIFVSNERVKKELLITSNSIDGGIIPEDLVVASFPSLTLLPFETIHFEDQLPDLTTHIKRYDRILGTFAYLKNYFLLLANKFEFISNLPDHYLFASQALNDAPPLKISTNEKAVSFYKQLFGLENGIENPALKWIIERVNIGKNFNDDDIREFGAVLLNNSKSTDFIVAAKQILNSLTKSLERKTAVKTITSLSDPERFYLYLFALLRIYGNANTEDKSISRADMPSFISNTYGEYVFSLLGYFYGYSTLRNYDDKITFLDPIFAQYIEVEKRIPIKFELTSLFDYIIIESVYENVFISKSDKIDTSFLESKSIRKEWLRKPNQLPKEYTFTTIDVFGKNVYHIQKKSQFDEILEKLNKIAGDIPVISDLGTYCFYNGLPRHFNGLDILSNLNRGLPFIVYFKKDEIIDALKSKKLNPVETLKRLEIGSMNKQF